MTLGRFAIFLSIVLSIWAAMHVYVFWRLAGVPLLAAHISRRTLFLAGFALWCSYILARFIQSWGWSGPGLVLEFVGTTWIGTLFLLFCTFLLIEVVTAGGWLAPRLAPILRTGAVPLVVVLTMFALVQGLRPPVIRDHEVTLPGLPPERDGLVLVAISDVHVGTLVGRGVLSRLVTRVNGLQPDLIAVVGDLVDGNVNRVRPLLPILQELRAPLGKWAVTGNHEYYAGLDDSLQLFEKAGFSILRDKSAEAAPGLILAGVDDLTVRGEFGSGDGPVTKALSGRRPGGVVFLCHSPLQAQTAAAHGAGLMLSGHTHDGQIWPFRYLVGLRYPFLAGRYQVDSMCLIVGRGTATWGPRMRLWFPSEILRIRLKAALP